MLPTTLPLTLVDDDGSSSSYGYGLQFTHHNSTSSQDDHQLHHPNMFLISPPAPIHDCIDIIDHPYLHAQYSAEIYGDYDDSCCHILNRHMYNSGTNYYLLPPPPPPFADTGTRIDNLQYHHYQDFESVSECAPPPDQQLRLPPPQNATIDPSAAACSPSDSSCTTQMLMNQEQQQHLILRGVGSSCRELKMEEDGQLQWNMETEEEDEEEEEGEGEEEEDDDNSNEGEDKLIKHEMNKKKMKMEQEVSKGTVATTETTMKKKKITSTSSRKKQKRKKKREREARVALVTRSEVEVLEDGYRWRKYGQKAVKNSPHPRSYFRCTHSKCFVKKRVERCTGDPSFVITTYEGHHTHHSPTLLKNVMIMEMPHPHIRSVPHHHHHPLQSSITTTSNQYLDPITDLIRYQLLPPLNTSNSSTNFSPHSSDYVAPSQPARKLHSPNASGLPVLNTKNNNRNAISPSIIDKGLLDDMLPVTVTSMPVNNLPPTSSPSFFS